MADTNPRAMWRRAAVERWYSSQDHAGQADTDPEPYIAQAADAAVEASGALFLTDEERRRVIDAIALAQCEAPIGYGPDPVLGSAREKLR